jgi:type IX secretion system PorP/SprF family membrane protein
MRKTVVFCVLLGLLLGTGRVARAQDPQFSQYYAAPLYLNPAMAGLNQIGRAGVNYRNQWPSIPANFVTYSFYADYNFEDYNSSAGLLVNTDQEGIAGLRSTSVALMYAYQVRINYNWTFRPALQVGYYWRDLNFDQLTFGDQFNDQGLVRPFTGEQFNTGLNARFLDFSAGGIVFNKNVWLGFAMHHINEPNQSIAGGDNPLRKRISLHGGYRIDLADISPFFAMRNSSRERSITPTFNYKAQADFDQLDLGFYLTLEPLLVGLWYRGVPIKRLENIPNNESIITMVGLNMGSTTVGYSFDYTLSNLGIGSGGAHEISIVYTFSLADPSKPPRDVRELRCPVPFIF